MKRSPAAAVLFLIFSLVFLGQGAAQSYVWCITDGHAALEQAEGGRCAADSPTPLPPAGLSAEDDHCGPCLDLPADSPSFHGRSRLDPTSFAVSISSDGPALPALFSVPRFVASLDVSLLPQPPPRSAIFLQSLRTTVLLI